MFFGPEMVPVLIADRRTDRSNRLPSERGIGGFTPYVAMQASL